MNYATAAEVSAAGGLQLLILGTSARLVRGPWDRIVARSEELRGMRA
jgi:hypothetical protein